MLQRAVDTSRSFGCRKESSLQTCRRPHLHALSTSNQRTCSSNRAIASSGQGDFKLQRPLARPQRPENINSESEATADNAPRLEFRPTENSCAEEDFDKVVEEVIISLENGADPKEAVTAFCVNLLSMVEHGTFRSSPLVYILEQISTVIARTGVSVRQIPEANRLLVNLALQIDDNLQEYSGEELSKIFQFYGRLGPGIMKLKDKGLRGGEAVSHLCLQAEAALPSMTSDDVSRMMWGLGSLKFTHCDGLLDGMVHRATHGVKNGTYDPRHMSTLVWAIGKLGFRKGHILLRALSRRAKGHMQEFSPQDISRFVWGISQVDFRGVQGVLVAAVEEVNRRVDEFSPRELIDITFALSKMEFSPGDDFLDRASHRLCKNSDNISQTDISKFLYASAVQGHGADTFLAMAKSHFKTNARGYRVQDTSTVLWSLAVLDRLDSDILLLGINRISSSSEVARGNVLAQLYQSILHLKLVKGLNIPDIGMPEEMEQQCQVAWRSQRKRTKAVTGGRIIKILKGMGYTAHEHKEVSSGDFCLDMFETMDGQQVVVDVITSRHIYSNVRSKVLPSRLWFVEAYRSLGLKILQIKEEEWNQVPEHSKKSHLQRKIASILES